MYARGCLLFATLGLLAPACGGDDGETSATGARDGLGVGAWVVDRAHQSVVHHDAAGRVAGSVDICCRPRDIAVASDGVWVSTEDGTVVRIDPERHEVVAEIDATESPGLVSVGESGVWVSDTGGGIVRIDPVLDETVGRVEVGGDGEGIAGLQAAGDSVWVLVEPAFGVYRVEVETMDVAARTRMCEPEACEYGAFTVVDGTAWVLNDAKGDLLGLDAESLDTTERLEIAEPGVLRDVVELDGRLYLLDPEKGRILSLDADAPGELTAGPTDDAMRDALQLRTAAGALWLHSTDPSAIVRIDPDDSSVTGYLPLESITTYAMEE